MMTNVIANVSQLAGHFSSTELSPEKKTCENICAPMISNFKQLGGTLDAVWLLLTAAEAQESCVSTAIVRNLTGNISLTPTKAVKGTDGKQAPDRSLQGCGEHCCTQAG